MEWKVHVYVILKTIYWFNIQVYFRILNQSKYRHVDLCYCCPMNNTYLQNVLIFRSVKHNISETGMFLINYFTKWSQTVYYDTSKNQNENFCLHRIFFISLCVFLAFLVRILSRNQKIATEGLDNQIMEFVAY